MAPKPRSKVTPIKPEIVDYAPERDGWPEPPPASARALPAPERPVQPRFDLEGHMVSVFSVLGFLLSARALLGLVLAGAFVLGIYAMSKGDILSLVCLGIYGLITVPGLIYLELHKSPPAQK